MSAVKLGIVGCGIAMRELHYPALSELRDLFSVVGVTSRTRESAETCAELFGTESYAYDELLRRVEAVDIAVPTHLNRGLIEKALDAGVHVICEKPIAESVETGERIVEIAGRAKPVLYIAENYRHYTAYTKARELLKEIGEPEFVLYSRFQCMERNFKYAGTEWRKEPKHVGGFLSDGGVHDVAAMRMVVGDVKGVRAFASTVRSYLGSYDTMAASLLFENGLIGNYSVSYGLSGEDLFVISGTEGRMRIDKKALRIEKNGGEKEIRIGEEDTYKKELIDFYEVLNGKKNRLGSPEEALKDLRVIEEAVKSSERA